MEAQRYGYFRTSFILFFTLLFVLVSCAFPEKRADSADLEEIEASLLSPQVINGGLAVVNLKLPAEAGRLIGTSEEDAEESAEESSTEETINDINYDISYKVEFDGKEIPLIPVEGAQNLYQALIGIPFQQLKGLYQVKVLSGDANLKVLPLEVIEGEYPSEVLTVNPRHVSPGKKDLIRIRKEQEELNRIYSTVTPKKYWKGTFQLPLKSRVTSVFGSRRVYNGELKSFHSGLDLAAAVGTPIRSAAPGKVVLAKSLFYSGNTVIVDHGYGLYTLYAHLSQFKVKKDEEVNTGQLLGLAGMTGRVNGPHLHWGAIVHQVKFNPEELTRLIQ